MIAAAPPTLAHYFAHYAAQHRDTPFLVNGDERLTFGEVYDHGLAVARALVADARGEAGRPGRDRRAQFAELDRGLCRHRLCRAGSRRC